MGFFDGWINALRGGFGGNKVKSKKYYNTDEKEFLELIPTGNIFVGVIADRIVEPFKNGFNFVDFIRGAIRGKSKSYWQHVFLGIKFDNGEVKIIEALDKITINNLSVNFKPENQFKLFFPPVTEEESIKIWKRAKTRENEKYDYLEIFDKVSFLGKLFNFRWGDKNKTVCHAFAVWAFGSFCQIIDPKISYCETDPGDVNTWLEKMKHCGLLVYNLDPDIHN